MSTVVSGTACFRRSVATRRTSARARGSCCDRCASSGRCPALTCDGSGEEVEAARARGFRVAADEAGIGPQDVIVICVPTPLSEADGPDLGAVRAAAQTAGRLLRPGTLVSLESTTYPGTTDEVVRPLLEKTSGLTAGLTSRWCSPRSGSTRVTASTAW